MGNLGFGIKTSVKVPKEIRTAAKEVPALRVTGDNFVDVMDRLTVTWRVTLLAAVVLGVGYGALWAWNKRRQHQK